MKVAKTKKPQITTLRAATTTLKILDFSGRSGAKARLTPTNKSAAAIANSSRVAQGKSRVPGNQMKTKKQLANAIKLSRKPAQIGQLNLRKFMKLLSYRSTRNLKPP